jgi:hypothetical protein
VQQHYEDKAVVVYMLIHMLQLHQHLGIGIYCIGTSNISNSLTSSDTKHASVIVWLV